MISQETLEAVKVGILTDAQLEEALIHYRQLEKDLKCHGEIFFLCWKEVYMTMLTLEGFKEARKRK